MDLLELLVFASEQFLLPLMNPIEFFLIKLLPLVLLHLIEHLLLLLVNLLPELEFLDLLLQFPSFLGFLPLDLRLQLYFSFVDNVDVIQPLLLFLLFPLHQLVLHTLPFRSGHLSGCLLLRHRISVQVQISVEAGV